MLKEDAGKFKEPSCCGGALALGRTTRLSNLIFQASEQRQIQKARRLGLDWSAGLAAQEQRLFALLLRSLGYSHFAEPFESLASRYSYRESMERLKKPQGRLRLLADWLGELGLLGSETEGMHEAYRPIYRSYQASFKGEVLVQLKLKGRPSNHPLRRLTGLAHHLEGLGGESLVKYWLRFFYQAQGLLKGPKALPNLLKALDERFAQPPDEPLAWLASPTSSKTLKHAQRLIGPSRQRVVLINGLMPFFLSWALFSKDRALEKTLFGLFLLMPAEGPNFKTEALERRLACQELPLRRNLAYHQGLIQFHDELCHHYGPTCQGCPLPGWLRETA
ncbi:MAG: DUF2851 family protein [bacterium]|nr:DUF2851 family protein [bacterium]